MGDTTGISGALSSSNMAVAEGCSESLNAVLVPSGINASGSGSISRLADVATANTSLRSTLNTSNVGVITGAMILVLSTDGTGVDGQSAPQAGSQTASVSGTVYAYAAPILSAGTLDSGTTRVGDMAAAMAVNLVNGITSSAYQGSLFYSAAMSGPLSGGGTDSLLAGTSTSRGFTLSTANSGSIGSTTGAANTLLLLAGGAFNLSLPTKLVNIGTIQAYEGQTNGDQGASPYRTITSRKGPDISVNVLPSSAAQGQGISIVGAANQDIINLGSGTDSVVIDGAREVINCGSGTVLLSADPIFASGKIVRGSGATTLTLTAAGTATLNAADTRLTIQQTGTGKLTLGPLEFIKAIDRSNADTLIASASSDRMGSPVG